VSTQHGTPGMYPSRSGIAVLLSVVYGSPHPTNYLGHDLSSISKKMNST
jgi:hypothetical protein